MYYSGYENGKTWKELGVIGDSVGFTTDEAINTLAIGMLTGKYGDHCAMDSAVRYSMITLGMEAEPTAKELINRHTKIAYLVEAGLIATTKIEGVLTWVYDKGGQMIHRNHPTSKWGSRLHISPHEYKNNHITIAYKGSYYWNSKWIKTDLDLAQPVMRTLINSVDEKDVLKKINNALNRMKRGGSVTQVTQGRGRKFKWNSWGWLNEIRTKHISATGKVRKEGDVVNGWVYTPLRYNTHYGLQTPVHGWKPLGDGKVVLQYDVLVSVTRGYMEFSTYNYGYANNKNNITHYNDSSKSITIKSFTNKAEADSYASTIEHSEVLERTNSIHLKGEAEVETLPSPSQMHQDILRGKYKVYQNSIDNISIKKWYKGVTQQGE